MKIAKVSFIFFLVISSLLASILIKDFTIPIIGLLVILIFVILLFKPKILTKKIFDKKGHINIDKEIKKEISNDIKKFESKLSSEYTIVFLLGIIIFSILALFKYEIIKSQNPIIDYFTSSFNFFNSNPLYFLIIPIMFLIYFLIAFGNKSKLRSIKFIQGASLIFVSFLTTFLVVLLIAIINISVIVVSSRGSFISGYVSDPTQIRVNLSKSDKVPKVIVFSNSLKKDLIISSLDFNGKSNYYENSVLRAVPNLLFEAIKSPNDPIFLFNDILVVREINQETIESISPTLGRTIVRLGVPDKNIKHEPFVDVLNRQEYIKLREDQINEKVREIESKIGEVDKYVSSLNSGIYKAKNGIASNENAISIAISQKDSSYQYCKTAGYTSYYFNTFYRYYTDSECDSKRAEWDAYINQAQANINQWKSILGGYQRDLTLAREVRTYLADSKDLVEAQKQSTPSELGLFLPENEIKIALDTTKKDYLKEYIATLIHEYLHYASYVSEERSLEHSIEEGMTESITKKVMDQEIGEYKQLGYPIMVRLIEEISKKITYNDLLDIYFTKDQEKLEYLLNQAYGKDFYKDTEFYFQIINYLDSAKAIKIANNILVRMGGETINEEDLR